MSATLHSRSPVVCVVDGDPAVRDSLKYLCDSNGHVAVGFATRASFLRALDQVQAQLAKSVICEAQLPDGSGVEVFAELRRRGMAVPFALLVSSHTGRAVRQATLLGIEHVWPKPLSDGTPLVDFLGQAESW